MMVWHGHGVAQKGRCHIAGVSPADHVPSPPRGKANIPLPRKEERKEGEKKRKEGKRKRLMHCPLHICLFFKKKQKHKSSSPQAKHNLTSKFGGPEGGEGESRHALTGACASLLCHTNWSTKTQFKSDQTDGNSKKNKANTKTNKAEKPTTRTVDLVDTDCVKVILSPLIPHCNLLIDG